MYSEIFNLINTKSQLSLLLYETELLRDSLFKTQVSFEQILETQVRPSIATAIQNSLNNSKVDKETFLKGLRVEIGKFSELAVVLAFEASAQTFEILGRWVKDNLSDKTVLDISFDNSLIAGGILVYKGKYIDLSIKKLINEYFISHKKEIEDSLVVEEAK